MDTAIASVEQQQLALNNDRHNRVRRSRSLLKFLVLVLAFSIPFWLIGALTRLDLLPGLPIAALIAVCPVLAAVILVYREGKSEGVATLLKRSFDFTRIRRKIWFVPTILLMPMVSALSYAALRLGGTWVPVPTIALLPALILCVVFFISALCEELGWSGCAIEPMQERWGALKASLVLGMIWAVWHYIPLIQEQRPAPWIAWWSLSTVTQRVIIVWLYNNTGRSVFAAALFHMTFNVTWQLFPVNGSYFDPGITGVILAVIALVIALVWEGRTLTRFRISEDSG